MNLTQIQEETAPSIRCVADANVSQKLEFAKVLKPGRLIDRGWPLRAHKKAIEHAPKAARAGHAKTVFEIAA